MQINQNKNRMATDKEINADFQSNGSNRKCKKYFFIDGEVKVYFNADFDSGNLEKVQQISPYVYRVCPGYDKQVNSTNKTFFHFKVFGFRHCKVRFHIGRVQILQKLIKSGQQSSYRPVCKKGKAKYEPIKKGVKICYNRSDEVELSIQYDFDEEQGWTYFAFSFPYAYEQIGNLVKELRQKYTNNADIYFHQQNLGFSQELRKLPIIYITERINCSKQKEDQVQGILPERKQTSPFKIQKPKVIISGRVHPGETPASYCIEGLLRFLLDEKDYRAYLLRKKFHFIIIPMLNPDGVFHGMFRNDLNSENLNRVYVNCSKNKHPTIWCFKQYLKHLEITQQPVAFYFDFHAHPSRKQFFIYGNAFNQFVHQVEAETFGKVLESNCPYFHNIDSIFAEKQMNSKDRYDALTKQGCARVFVHKLFNIIHSFTVQCGYFAPGSLQNWQSPEVILERSQVMSQQYGYVSTWQKCSSKTYTPQSYMLMGKSILITILDIFHLNPYPRININQLRSIATIRKNVAIRVYNCVERFRLIDANVTKKIKQLTIMLENDYYKPRFGEFEISISQNYGMKHPKKKFFLLSRVYMSKKETQIETAKQDLLNMSGNNFYKIVQEADQQQQQEQNSIQEDDILKNNIPSSFHRNNKIVKIQSESDLKPMKCKKQVSSISLNNQMSIQCLSATKIGPNALSAPKNKSSFDSHQILSARQNSVKQYSQFSGKGFSRLLLGDRQQLAHENYSNSQQQRKERSESCNDKSSIIKIKGIFAQKPNPYAIDVKLSRVDEFLRKQMSRGFKKQMQRIQKHIISNKEIQQPSTSRFPSLYSTVIEEELIRNRK